MISVEDFLRKVAEIDAEHPQYEKGKDGTGGKCDCIGLVIGAIRRAGGRWNGSHGSNYAARYAVRNLHPVSHAADLQVGEVVFKKYEPGEAGWNLPSTYSDHYDQRDYYHVGVVSSVTPLCIVHCTSPTTKHDNALGQWSFAAELKEVDYTNGGHTVMYQAIIVTETSPLRVREWPITGTQIGKVPKGKTVDVLAESTTSPGWFLIRYGELEGYASGEYLQKIDASGGTETTPPAPETGSDEETVSIDIPREAALALSLALNRALGVD